jgi:hypothetical protein
VLADAAAAHHLPVDFLSWYGYQSKAKIFPNGSQPCDIANTLMTQGERLSHPDFLWVGRLHQMLQEGLGALHHEVVRKRHHHDIGDAGLPQPVKLFLGSIQSSCE